MLFRKVQKSQQNMQSTSVDVKCFLQHILEKKQKAAIFWGFFTAHFKK